jgi:hypothetical protein
MEEGPSKEIPAVEVDTDKEEGSIAELETGNAPVIKQDEFDKDEQQSKSWTRKKYLTLLAILAAVAVVVVPIAVALSIKVKNVSSEEGVDEDIDETGTYANTTMTEIAAPFNTSLKYFNKEILQGYETSDELSVDLEQAAWFLLNQIVDRNTGENYHQPPWNERDSDIADTGMPIDGVFDEGMSEAAPGVGAVPDDVSDFGTNNQEEFVEEGDVIVSDGDHVYAAYGDYIAIWEPRNGTLVKKVKMPPIEDTRRLSMMIEPGYWQPTPTIHTLLLEGDTLLVIVGGYGYMMQEKMGLDHDPILSDFMGTQLRLYNTSNVASGTLKLIGVTNVHGTFTGVRAFGGNAHVMTTSYVNTYNELAAPFQRWDWPSNMTDEEYIEEVYRTAKDKAIPSFIDKLVKELKMGGEMPRLARVCLWQKEGSGTNLEQMAFSEGVINTLAQIHSLDMTGGSKNLKVSSSGSFLPSYWARFYGSTEALIIAGQGWDFNPRTRRSIESTYLIGFGVDGASSTPNSIGSVDGYVSFLWTLRVILHSLLTLSLVTVIE